jgi:hypothetical protein
MHDVAFFEMKCGMRNFTAIHLEILDGLSGGGDAARLDAQNPNPDSREVFLRD